jgi:hypothetical protein
VVEPFAASVLSTFFLGRVYLRVKHTSASVTVVRTIGASNKHSLAANFFTLTARGAKGKTNVDIHVWDSREWALPQNIQFGIQVIFISLKMC